MTYYQLGALNGVKYELSEGDNPDEWIEHECGICRRVFYSKRQNGRWCSVSCRASGRANDEYVKREIRRRYKGVDYVSN